MKSLLLATTLILTLGLSRMAAAEPVILGDPSKGTPITEVNNGKAKVQITTTGISVEKGDENVDSDGESVHKTVKVNGVLSELEDILVPLFFFLFLIAIILGRRYFDSRNEERRLNLLKLMVEKGQPLPAETLNQMLAKQATPEGDESRQSYKRTRNAFGFTLAGALLAGHALLIGTWHNEAELVSAVIFLSLGLGGLAGIYLPSKRNQETPVGQ